MPLTEQYVKGKDDDEEEVNSETREKGERPCSTLPMMSLRLCQIMSPVQNADGAGQRQATASGKQPSVFCKKVTVT